MKTHKCMAKGCKLDIAEAKLMCARHWHGLPLLIRSEVLEGYASRLAGEPRGEKKHLAAVRKAIKFYLVKDDAEKEEK